MDARLRNALNAMVAELKAMPEVTGILFFGSAQRGAAGPESDLDFYAIVSGNQYWRVGKICEGVPVEVLFNPAAKLRDRMTKGDPVTMHGFATGELLLDTTGEGAELVALARSLWAAGPRPLSPWEVATHRYRLTDLALDIEDVGPGAPEARLMAGVLVPRVLEAYCALHGVWPEKPKRLLAQFGALEPQLYAMAKRFYAGDQDPKLAVAMADYVLAPFGGRIFEYESEKGTC